MGSFGREDLGAVRARAASAWLNTGSRAALRLRAGLPEARRRALLAADHEPVRQLVAVAGPRREVLGQHGAAALDAGDQTVAQ